jgi:hypothetical protein
MFTNSGVFRRGEPGYPLQVLALPSSGCGLFTSIPHAKRFQKKFTKLLTASFVISIERTETTN